MRDIRFNISLYVIVPVIFAGIALLSVIISYNVTGYYLRKGLDPVWPVIGWGILIMFVTFLCGLLIVRIVLSPLERFVRNTEKLGVLQSVSDAEEKPEKTDDIGRFTQIFEQVSELLSKVDSKALFPEIIGQSKAMRGVFNQIIKVAPTDSTVLILGETGTGKELVSKSIHEHSLREGKPFIAINCAAIPEGLLESELFGHEKGAFTGAGERKLGKFEIAGGGTIFMDEIGDMPMETQAKILRIIENGQVERIGGVRPIKVDVRLVAATNQDLSKMVAAGKFRQDLYYRLNVFAIRLPPLRERIEDIPALVEKFVKDLNKNLIVSPECMQFLTAYDWPGNVRELQNTLEGSSVLTKDVIHPMHLPSIINGGLKHASLSEIPDFPQGKDLDRRLKDLEKGMIVEALARAGGVQITAAKLLGIKERSLWHRIKKLGIDVASIKQNIS
ncbi:sigma-54 interaction domain-containing protein [Thermodesulfobacteriota bacterium]